MTGLLQLAILSGNLYDVPRLKTKHFAALAKTLDAGEMKDFAQAKRAAIIICLIQRAQVKTRDSIAEMFVKRL